MIKCRLQKHLRELLRELDAHRIKVDQVTHSKSHYRLRVSRGELRATLTLASSPRDPDNAVASTMRNAERALTP